MASAADRARAAAHERDRQVVLHVLHAVGDAGAVHDHDVVQQRAVPVGRRREPCDVVREQLAVIGVDPGHRRHPRGLVRVVRQRVVRIRHPDLGVRETALLAGHHEGDDARQVGLVREQLQVEHQPGVFPVARRDAGGPLEERQLVGGLPVGDPQAPLHVAHALDVLVDPVAISRTNLAPQPDEGVEHGVEDAVVLREARAARGGAGARAFAEHPLEDQTRVVLHRQRRRRVAPRDGVGIDATVAAAALTRVADVLDGELERRELRLPAELPRHDLIHRHAAGDVVLARVADGAAQERRGGVRRVPGQLQPRNQDEPIPEGGERFVDGPQLEARPDRRRCPVVHRHAVRHVDRPEAPDRFRRRPDRGRQRRHHRIEQRQGQRGAHAAQHGPPRQRPLRDAVHLATLSSDACVDAFIRNGVLLTTPSTRDDQR